VTGGGQGLGEGIARMLDDNGAAKVVIFDMDEIKGQAVASSLKNGLFFKVDVSSEESVKAGFQSVSSACGRLDVMVNSAGVVGPNGVNAEEVNTKDFDRVYEGNPITALLSRFQVMKTGTLHGMLWVSSIHCCFSPPPT